MPGTHARVAAVLLVLVLPGCVPSAEVKIAFDSGRFNDKVRGDFGPLQMDDLQADPRFGFFRSDNGVVSEVFPHFDGSVDNVSGRLVQTPCLFVGRTLSSTGSGGEGDELRLGWEVIGDLDRSADENIERFFQEHYEEVGVCTFSSPVKRLLFERPEAPLSEGGVTCRRSDEGFAVALTLNSADPEETANIPAHCPVGHSWPEVVLEAFPPDAPNPDGRCPAPGGRFAGRPTMLGDTLSACGFPGRPVRPVGDTSYRLSLRPGHAFGSATPERWLSPNTMFVSGGREVVRPLADLGGGSFHWQTPVVVHPRRDADKQWEENYMPTVLVERVEVLSRGGGGERNETPFENRLRILVPNPSGGADMVACIGRSTNGVFSFAIPDDCMTDNTQLRALTPTYAPAHLRGGGTPVTTPITWSVSLPSLQAGRAPFLRFRLRAEGAPRGALRISPALADFGTLQVGHWRQATLVLSNLGGPELEIRSVGFDAGSAHPANFSFVVAGDPVQVPLPIDAVAGSGGLTFGLSADASDAPVVRFEERPDDTVHISLGDPARGGGTERLRVYGHAARLVGNLFLRDDPSAVPAPTAPAHPRPLRIAALAERRLPFLLGRNQTAKIVVTARPSATGPRTAAIRVDAIPIGDPANPLRVVSQLRVQALSGPQLDVIPTALMIGTSQYRDSSRFTLMQNLGYFDLRVTRLAIVGRDAARFSLATSGRGAPPPLPFTLTPGAAQDVQVRYARECDGSYALPDHQATLSVESTGGNWQLPLYGYSQNLCP
jgi:hypothetical protein